MRQPIVKTTLHATLMLSVIMSSNCLADIVLDGSTGSSRAIIADNATNTYEIGADVGKISSNGNNLFHSFSTFNVEDQHIANFSGPTGVENIIARVTGPGTSEIYGSLSSTIDGANLYLINPNGIMFGANASLNITGSFYASTANYLVHNDGTELHADVSQDITLTTAPISAFGFSTNNTASIDVLGSQLSVNASESLSLIGGNISLGDSAKLSAASGAINLVGTASEGVVTLTDNDIALNNFGTLGNVSLNTGSSIITSGDTGGHIMIRGGALVMDQSNIEANATSSGDINYSKNVDLQTSTEITLDNASSVTANVGVDSDIAGKGILLESGKINIDNGSAIQSSVSSTVGGSGGDITVIADNTNITNYGNIISTTEDTGSGGNINIVTTALSMENGGLVASEGYGSGNTGNINIDSTNISIQGPESLTDPFYIDYTGLYTYKTSPDSGGGHIVIDNKVDIMLDRQAAINTYNDGAEVGGDIVINTESVNVLDGSMIGTSGDYGGNGGNITITSNSTNVAGVHLPTNLINPDEFKYSVSGIYSTGTRSSFRTGNPGDISITATSDLAVIDGAVIRIISASSADRGNININAKNINISGTNTRLRNAFIEFNGASEKGADFTSSSNISWSNFYTNYYGADIPPTSETISIIGDNLNLNSGGYISTETKGTNDSGDLVIDVDSLSLVSGAYITSDATRGAGNAGNITVKTNKLYINGESSASVTTGIYAGTNKNADGSGGNILINTRSAIIKNQGIISSESIGTGNGGDIKINSDSLTLQNRASVTTKASLTASGNAGNITTTSKNILLDNSEITTTAISGQGGDITINANQLIMTQDSVIDASSIQSVDGKININQTIGNLSKLLAINENTNTSENTFHNECSIDQDTNNTFHVKNIITNPKYRNKHYQPQITFESDRQQSYTHKKIRNSTSIDIEKPRC